MSELVRAEHRMLSGVWANSCLFFATDRQIRCCTHLCPAPILSHVLTHRMPME